MSPFIYDEFPDYWIKSSSEEAWLQQYPQPDGEEEVMSPGELWEACEDPARSWTDGWELTWVRPEKIRKRC